MSSKNNINGGIRTALNRHVIAVSCYRDSSDFPQVLYFIDKSRRTLIWLDILGVKDSVVLSEMSVIVALTKGMCAINII